ncbi:MAG: ATP-binding protein [Oscillospiraceae bacterium]|nr:ATP-binding protein [Oscillospiraceae bacterium]
MKRYAMSELIAWKNRSDQMPLIIRGARQVGKTWLMKEFGQNEFQTVAYVNFDNNERMEALFNGNYDTGRLLTGLQIEAGVLINPQSTLLIFDEIQEVPQAIAALKYFRENAPEYSIVAAGSLLGVALHKGTSFPVGKVDFMDMYPMSFLEFLEAVGRAELVELLSSKDWALIKAFRSTYIDLLRQYYFIGGMPEAVASFVSNQDYGEVRRIQNRLLQGYEQDFSKHAPNESVPRIRMLWDSVPAQLAKENKKFIYGLIRQGARAKEFELAMQWLLDCGMIHKINRVTKPGMPLSAYQDNAFKLYMLDVGLLAAKSGLDVKSLLEGNRIFEEFKGALTEQYVQQQLLSTQGIRPYYWSSAKGTAEVDFVFQHGMEVVPLEVKAEENLKARSLKSYVEKFSPEYAARTSMSDYRCEEWLVNVPLYAIGMLSQTLR